MNTTSSDQETGLHPLTNSLDHPCNSHRLIFMLFFLCGGHNSQFNEEATRLVIQMTYLWLCAHRKYIQITSLVISLSMLVPLLKHKQFILHRESADRTHKRFIISCINHSQPQSSRMLMNHLAKDTYIVIRLGIRIDDQILHHQH